MKTIDILELRDEGIYPDEKILRSTLDAAYDSYKRLLELFNKYNLAYEWKYYQDGKAWLCKVQKKNRTIVWMSAWKGFLKATIYIPQKHLTKLYESEISEEQKTIINQTKDVGKSKPCTFEIKAGGPIEDFETVMNLKIEFR